MECALLKHDSFDLPSMARFGGTSRLMYAACSRRVRPSLIYLEQSTINWKIIDLRTWAESQVRTTGDGIRLRDVQRRFTCVQHSNLIYVVGSHEVAQYDHQTSTWSSLPPMPTRREYVAAAIVNKSLVVVGGMTWDAGRPGPNSVSEMVATVETLSLTTREWKVERDLRSARAHCVACTVDSCMVIIGGTIYGESENYEIWIDGNSMQELCPLSVRDWTCFGLVAFGSRTTAGFSDDHNCACEGIEMFSLDVERKEWTHLYRYAPQCAYVVGLSLAGVGYSVYIFGAETPDFESYQSVAWKFDDYSHLDDYSHQPRFRNLALQANLAGRSVFFVDCCLKVEGNGHELECISMQDIPAGSKNLPMDDDNGDEDEHIDDTFEAEADFDKRYNEDDDDEDQDVLDSQGDLREDMDVHGEEEVPEESPAENSLAERLAALNIEVQRTFLCEAPKLPPGNVVLQSVTENYPSRKNPRRYGHASEADDNEELRALNSEGLDHRHRPSSAASSVENQADRNDRVFLLQYDSHPKEFFEALVEGLPLRACREAYAEINRHCVLPGSNAKIFVKPHQWNFVISCLQGLDLRPYHVVVTEDYEHLIEESLMLIKPKKRPQKKKGAPRIQLV